MSRITITAVGDLWQVRSPDLDRVEEFGSYQDAHRLAEQFADDGGRSIVIEHPRNVNMRGLTV